jgi:peptidoglycan/LPS O-acetylase OafA/YrhL
MLQQITPPREAGWFVLVTYIMNYRREIDGLRALAVLPVILFHAGFEFFSGGFVRWLGGLVSRFSAATAVAQ